MLVKPCWCDAKHSCCRRRHSLSAPHTPLLFSPTYLDGNRRCNIQFSTRQKEGFVDVTKDVVQFLPKQPLKIACSCKPHVPAEAHHTRGYWTGPDGLELVEITGAREDVRFVSKGRYTILKLRGKTPCTAAGLYTCHLRGSSRSIRIVMGGL